MITSFIIDKRTGRAFASIVLSSERASTFHSDHFRLDRAATVAGTESLTQDIMDEQEWITIVSNPRILGGLRRLAAEARRQAAEGEIEEGGFVVE
ncbi:MAG TPA: hypothetical protein VNE61_00770 [Ktedonobacteraceae bacterium]|nr:hypothetical protein [Ktedonobacteraceae bacterium]